ncbi:MAG TPA: PrsW family intramembrane metalloprotease, partial [Nodosilinea sp.]|nr:PrsW family intramembrane metalloprotease [Nodosilinea sp.]
FQLLPLLAKLDADATRIFFEALLWAMLLTVIPLAILWFLDRREPESRWLYAIAILWGGLLATGLALPLNLGIFHLVEVYLQVHPDLQAILGVDPVFTLGAPIAGPLDEELTKGLGVLLLFWLLKSEFDNVRDGFIYGALVGIGFNLFESALYVAQTSMTWGFVPWGAQLGLRHSMFGFGGHALFTGIFGMFLGLSRQTTRPWLHYAAPIIGWLLGYTAHFLYNVQALVAAFSRSGATATLPTEDINFLLAWLVAGWIKNMTLLPIMAIAVIMLWRSGVWERRVIQSELADEIGPLVTPAEYEAIKGDRIFKTRRIPGYRRRASAAIVKAQDELAFRKWRVKQLGQSIETDPLVLSWRDQLMRLRDSAAPVLS